MRRPRIAATGPAGFVLWLKQDQPAIYAQLARRVPELQNIDAALAADHNLDGLGWIAQVGSAIAGAARTAWPKIVAALPEIASAAVQVGGQVYAAKQQTELIKAQMKQAAAQQAPLQTATAPGALQVVDPATGRVTAQPRVVAATIIPGVPDVVTYVGGGLLALLIAKQLKLL